MLKKDLIEKTPLRIINLDTAGNLVSKRLGLLVARAGLGKTSILVQFALDNMLRGKNVLHVSIGQTLDKTRAWYYDIFRNFVKSYELENVFEVQDEITRHRMIMTFNESSFSRPKLEERLNDLIYQNIFRPDCLVIDGLDFGSISRETLTDMRELMEAMELQIWFSAVSHRDDSRVSAIGVPAPCHEMEDLFDTVIMLQAAAGQDNLVLNVVKDNVGRAGNDTTLNLDPATLLIQEA